MLLENILDNVPIDPLATHYWSPPTSTSGLLEPRGPLAAMKSTSASVNGPNRAIKMLGASDCSKPVKPGAVSGLKKLVSAEDMPAFKQAIQGSDLTKLGLIEVLNKQFPKIPKAVLKTTLETVARRVGSKEADKRWAVIENVIAGGT
jgi:chromatin assembly factor 1 subunit A